MLRSRICVSGLLALFVAACATGGPSDDKASSRPSANTTNGGPSGQPSMQVVKQDAQDVSPPLSELAKRRVPFVSERAHEAEPWRQIPHKQLQATGPVVDPVVQNAIG